MVGPIAPFPVVLAEGHDVDVVVDEHRGVVASGQVIGHGVVVPAGHDRRVLCPAGQELDGAGQADADGPHLVGIASSLGEKLVEAIRDHVEHSRRPLDDVDVSGRGGQNGAGEVGDGDPGVRGAGVRGEHHTTLVVEGERAGRPAAGGGVALFFGDQEQGQQGVHSLGHGRTGQTGQLHEFGAGARPTIADQLEDITRRSRSIS